MYYKSCIVAIFTAGICFGESNLSEYAKVTEELMISPVSAAMGGSVLSNGSGTTVESSPGNLPFDSLNRLSLAYAGFYKNTFSTSMLTYSGQPVENTGISIMIGYISLPNISNNLESDTNEAGELLVLKESLYTASKILFRAGVGHSFTLNPKVALGVGIAVNAKRTRLPETGYGISCDAGLTGIFPRTGMSTALLVENATSSYIYWNKNYKERSYPLLRAGVGWFREIPYIYGALRLGYSTPDLLAHEGVNTYTFEETKNGNSIATPGTEKIYKKPSILLSGGKLGMEYIIMKTVALRVGYSGNKFGFGGGVYLMGGRAGLDFAYLIHALDGTYQLSAQYAW